MTAPVNPARLRSLVLDCLDLYEEPRRSQLAVMLQEHGVSYEPHNAPDEEGEYIALSIAGWFLVAVNADWLCSPDGMIEGISRATGPEPLPQVPADLVKEINSIPLEEDGL